MPVLCKKIFCSAGLLFLAFAAPVALQFPGAVFAKNASEAQELVRLFESRYRAARTLQATFLERYTESGRTTRAEAGVAYFRRPGKMRWEYESPERNLFLVDGKTAWFYVPADHTATRVPAKKSNDFRTPLALLAGEMKVSRVCARVEVSKTQKPRDPANVVLYCALRAASGKSPESEPSGAAGGPETQSEAVFFEIVRDSGDLVRVLVRQSGGIEVELSFTGWRMDPPVPEAQFRFEPPRGVAIVNGELEPEEIPGKR